MKALRLKQVLRTNLSLIVVVTLLCLLVNIAVQQNFRMSANDPQVQLAEDTAHSLARNPPNPAFDTGPLVDIARSAAPWVAIYDNAARPLVSSGRLDGAAPSLPGGVFTYARRYGEDRVTWQPRRGVRSAIVVARTDGPHPFFVVAGRSLREIESRVDALNRFTLLAWIGTVLVSLSIALIASPVGNTHPTIAE